MYTEELIREIKKAGYNNKSFSEELGMIESTFYRKLKKGNFSVEEAQKMVEILNLNGDQAYYIFFNKKLA